MNILLILNDIVFFAVSQKIIQMVNSHVHLLLSLISNIQTASYKQKTRNIQCKI